MTADTRPAAVVERLYRAANAHDLDGIVACFAPDYRNETPAHPDRGFTGSDQVRRNWTAILAGVPDLTARITRMAVRDDTVWIETDHAGVRRDGTPHRLSGVVIFTVSGGLIGSARFYLEPVRADGLDADAAIAGLFRDGGPR